MPWTRQDSDGNVITLQYRTVPKNGDKLSALGFGADRMYVVRSVKCRGCPLHPYPKVEILDDLALFLAHRTHTKGHGQAPSDRHDPF